jgi:hypothetical protein
LKYFDARGDACEMALNLCAQIWWSYGYSLANLGALVRWFSGEVRGTVGAGRTQMKYAFRNAQEKSHKQQNWTIA